MSQSRKWTVTLILGQRPRLLVDGKPGVTPIGTMPILERLSLDPKVWCDLFASLGRLFFNVAGRPQMIDATPSLVTQQPYYLRGETRSCLFRARQNHRPDNSRSGLIAPLINRQPCRRIRLGTVLPLRPVTTDQYVTRPPITLPAVDELLTKND